MCRFTFPGVLLSMLMLAATVRASPAGIDLHDYWDQRCKECHGHSAAFARRYLRVEDQRLRGTHHRDDLEVFLRNHYLADDLIAPVSGMLKAQLTTPPLFSTKCSSCHGTAAAFARASLTLRDGVLFGNSTGRKVSDYLTVHGGLKPEDVPIVVASLARVRSEVTAPAR